jgi:hypothetical protein
LVDPVAQKLIPRNLRMLRTVEQMSLSLRIVFLKGLSVLALSRIRAEGVGK